MLKKQNSYNDRKDGQSSMEFMFSMIIIMLMIYGTIQIFGWSGNTLARRQGAHEAILTQPIIEDYEDPNDGPLKQLDTGFFGSIPMNAVFDDN